MIWQEIKYNIDAVLEMINESLASKYIIRTENEPGDYINNQQVPFSVCKLGDTPPWNCLTISYEDTGEDGDLFYPEDYEEYDDLLQALITEIEK